MALPTDPKQLADFIMQIQEAMKDPSFALFHQSRLQEFGVSSVDPDDKPLKADPVFRY